ncbi:hypothetical protein Tco_0613622 [Tanacetum coccineum]
MIPATTPLVGFSGEIIWPLGQISLLVKIGDDEYSTSAWMNFMVVRSPSPYNRIIGRLGVRRIRAVLSTATGMLKFPVAGETITLRSSMIILLECIMASGPGMPQPVINQVTEEKIQVAIHPISKANYSDRLYFDRRGAKRAVQLTKTQPGCIRQKACGYDWSSTAHS